MMSVDDWIVYVGMWVLGKYGTLYISMVLSKNE